jgi:6-methylsalicylate decarboxylase
MQAPSEQPDVAPGHLAETRGFVDTHHHVIPPGYASWLSAKGWPLSLPTWSANSALAAMDRQGVHMAIISLSTPGLYRADLHEARHVAREINQFCATVSESWPDRFGFFATVTLPDVDGASAEAVYALDELGADGVVILSNARGHYPGEEQFAPFFAELDGRDSVLLVHPTFPHESGPPVEIGNPRNDADLLVDTTRAAISLVTSGFLDRFARTHVILSHAGGFLPYMSHRIAPMCVPDREYSSGVASLRRFYFDVALSSSSVALPTLLAFASEDHILFGSDWPFAAPKTIDHFRREFDDFPLGGPLRQAITYRNAQRLFRRAEAGA